MTLSPLIERFAGHQALKYVNYSLGAMLVFSTLFTVREAVNTFFMGDVPELSSEAKAPASAADKKPGSRTLSRFAPAVSNNVFGIAGQELTEISAESAGTIDAAQNAGPAQTAPEVAISLLGTVAWADNTGYAFVHGSDREQQMYKSGQEIPGAGILTEVYPDRVVMEYADNQYEVLLDELKESSDSSARRSRANISRASKNKRVKDTRKTGGKDFSKFARRTGKNEFAVSKRAIDETINNPQNVLTDARLLPNTVGGAQKGFKVTEIKSGGLYEHLGLTNGDILLAVNKFKLDSPESALQAFTTLQGASKINIELERRGKKIDLKYNIK